MRGNEKMASACRTRLRELVANMEVRSNPQMLPAKLLAEDFCNISISLHKEQVQKMYDEGVNGTLPPIFRHLSFLIANYLGYSTANMDINLCIPHLAILQHEMSKYLPFYDHERESLRHRFGNHPTLVNIYHKAEWESVLEGLMDEAEGKGQGAKSEEPEIRLMYLRESPDSHAIQVREQTRLKNGAWGNGKRLSDARYRKGEMECMNNADRRILARLNHSDHWELQLEDVIEEMVDESRLYVGRTAPFELVKVDRDKPYLIVENEGRPICGEVKRAVRTCQRRPCDCGGFTHAL